MAPLPSTAVPPSESTNQLPSTVVSPMVSMIIRILTFIFLFISVVIIFTIDEFSMSNTLCYLLTTGVVGIAYTLYQTAFIIYFMTTGTRFGGDGLFLLDFYGDKAVSYMLATGASACLGLTLNAKEDSADVVRRATTAASFVLIGFFFSAASSIFSSLSLPKRS